MLWKFFETSRYKVIRNTEPAKTDFDIDLATHLAFKGLSDSIFRLPKRYTAFTAATEFTFDTGSPIPGYPHANAAKYLNFSAKTPFSLKRLRTWVAFHPKRRGARKFNPKTKCNKRDGDGDGDGQAKLTSTRHAPCRCEVGRNFIKLRVAALTAFTAFTALLSFDGNIDV
jgi:hypothetical protein